MCAGIVSMNQGSVPGLVPQLNRTGVPHRKSGGLRGRIQWTSGTREQHGIMVGVSQLAQQKQHLALAAAHLAAGIDVHNSHRIRSLC
jgi:hypothetical protein